ncbi:MULTISPECIES: hypothetical protein [unclassified Streptomyces]|uniref:hypothetical protein n=1 Tax=unclassified Streptomyces TaxID=2593676 RepID=UPI00382B4D4B
MNKPLEPAMKGMVKTVLLLGGAGTALTSGLRGAGTALTVVRVLKRRGPHKRPGSVNLS